MTENEQSLSRLKHNILTTLNKAARQCRNTIVKEKTKVTCTEYDEELKKPVSEQTTETEQISTLKGTVDIAGLKTISDILKTVCEIKGGQNDEETAEAAAIILASISELDNEA